MNLYPIADGVVINLEDVSSVTIASFTLPVTTSVASPTRWVCTFLMRVGNTLESRAFETQAEAVKWLSGVTGLPEARIHREKMIL